MNKLANFKKASNLTDAWSVFGSNVLPNEELGNEKKVPLDEEQQAKLNKALDKIRQQHPVLQFILIGFRNLAKKHSLTHYFVLAIVSEGQKEMSRTDFHREFKLTLLFHLEESVKYGLEKNNRFFSQVLSFGKILYERSNSPVQFVIHKADWPNNYKRMITVWKRRLYYAQLFFDSAVILMKNNKIASEPTLILLSHCVEQVCIGYIYVHTGYHVHKFTIPFLLTICDLINPEMAEIINNDTEELRRRRNALFTCISDMRYKTQVSLTRSEINFLIARCDQLLQFADTDCSAELDAHYSLTV